MIFVDRGHLDGIAGIADMRAVWFVWSSFAIVFLQTA